MSARLCYGAPFRRGIRTPRVQVHRTGISPRLRGTTSIAHRRGTWASRRVSTANRWNGDPSDSLSRFPADDLTDQLPEPAPAT